jgi:hypothetical protein
MSRARHLALDMLIVVFILSLVAPAMTCALPDAGMTTQERACCREMKGHCASKGMPASHSCCHQTIANRFDAVQPHPVSVPAIAVVAILSTPSYFDFRSFVYGRVSFQSQTPAISPPSAISVLRV